jgi:hypothetical protein
MKTTTLSLAVLSFFLFNCDNHSHENATETATIEEHQHAEVSPGIELDNGQKWQVNAEMTPYVQDAEKALSDYDNENYTALASQLTEKNQALINSCTMDGKSHDELHKWLHPHMELVKALSEAENTEKANQIVNEIKESFQTYNTYFQ